MSSDIVIGILSEGVSDIASLEEICHRLLVRLGITATVAEKLSRPANGPISEKVIKLRTALFKKGDVDLAFYFADADKIGFNKKYNLIKGGIQGFDESWLDRSVIGVPDRNLEAWLLSDQNTVKRLLNLDAGEALPHGKIKDPKERFLRIVSEHGEDSLTPSAFRRKMAKEADLDEMARRSDSFKAFCDELSVKTARFRA